MLKLTDDYTLFGRIDGAADECLYIGSSFGKLRSLFRECSLYLLNPEDYWGDNIIFNCPKNHVFPLPYVSTAIQKESKKAAFEDDFLLPNLYTRTPFKPEKVEVYDGVDRSLLDGPLFGVFINRMSVYSNLQVLRPRYNQLPDLCGYYEKYISFEINGLICLEEDLEKVIEYLKERSKDMGLDQEEILKLIENNENKTSYRSY